MQIMNIYLGNSKIFKMYFFFSPSLSSQHDKNIKSSNICDKINKYNMNKNF